MEGISPILSKKGELSGKRVFVRTDFNLPLSSVPTLEHPRIAKTLRTINFLKQEGAKIILGSHAEPDEASLKPIAELLDIPLIVELENEKLSSLNPGEVVLLENLRHFPGEKENDRSFGESLAALADIYVNEAFSTSHRPHTSIITLPELLPSYVGITFEEEVKELSRLNTPERPFIVVVSGAKFESKLPAVTKFLEHADQVFVGGALANSFFKLQGYEVGRSMHEEWPELEELLHNPKLLLPSDVVVEGGEAKEISNIQQNEKIVDAGPETLELLSQRLNGAKTILIAGPLGEYESGYTKATLSLAETAANSGAFSVIGGGDTLEIIPLELQSRFGFVSTGGGAMLDFLVEGTLLGIEALKKS